MMQECYKTQDCTMISKRFAFSPTGQPFCIYGDLAYPLRIHLQAPFRNGILTPPMQEFNSSMSQVRGSVEWLFGDIINYFCFLDFTKKVKIGLSQIGKKYIVCALLRNSVCFPDGELEFSFHYLTVFHHGEQQENKPFYWCSPHG